MSSPWHLKLTFPQGRRLLPNRALSRLDKKTFSLPRSSRCPPCPRGEHFIVSLFIVLLPSSCIPGFLMTLILPHRSSMILLPCVNIVDLTPITSSLGGAQNLLQGFGFSNYHLYTILIQLSQQRPLVRSNRDSTGNLFSPRIAALFEQRPLVRWFQSSFKSLQSLLHRKRFQMNIFESWSNRTESSNPYKDDRLPLRIVFFSQS